MSVSGDPLSFVNWKIAPLIGRKVLFGIQSERATQLECAREPTGQREEEGSMSWGGVKCHDGNPQGSTEVAAGDTVNVQEKLNTRLKSGRAGKSPQTRLELFNLKNQKETVDPPS